MLARNTGERPPQAATVMNALGRFSAPAAPAWEVYDLEHSEEAHDSTANLAIGTTVENSSRVLIVNDDPAELQSIRETLTNQGCEFGEAATGEAALQMVRAEPYGVLLLKLDLRDIHGYEICSRLRVSPPRPHLKIIVLAAEDKNDLAEVLGHGADDCMSRPLNTRQLGAKVMYMLRLKDAQDRSDLMARHLLLANRQLADSLQARTGDVRHAHDALLFAMAKMAESRDETPGHLRRLQLYCRALCETLADDPSWSGVLSGTFTDLLDRCVPLHDIGKLGVPESVLTKPGPLNPNERTLIKTHPVIGATMLESLSKQFGDSLGFLPAATAIVRHHHERYDGEGYPDRLSGDGIPPAARLTALADVYDALRRKRFHKSALTHEDALKAILEKSDGQFDPNVLQGFSHCHEKFRTIYQQIRD
jgi:putative two-component system response regulator